MSPRLRRRCTAGVSIAVSAALMVSMTGVPAVAQSGQRTGVSFDRLATYPLFLSAPDPSVETVAEITAVSSDGLTLISTDSPGKRVVFTDISDPARPVPGTGGNGVAVPGFVLLDGEPTSVAVYGEYALVAVNTSASFSEPSGDLVVLRVADRSMVRRIALGGQPDSIALSPAGAVGGTYAAVAIENERDEEVNDGLLPQTPAGFLSTVKLVGDPGSWAPARLDLTRAIEKVPGIYAPEDPEPEYVTVNSRNQVAVTLQENNAIVVVDAGTNTVIKAFTAGTVDLQGIDTVEDDTIDLTGSLSDVPREPDAIAWIGDGLLATANEGDLFGGSRGWSVFDAGTGQVVWDAGNDFEHLAVSVGLYPESRSENKGAEPEGIAAAAYGGRQYVFVGAERGNFVAVYDVTEPATPVFQQVLPATNGPEGLLPIPGRDLFVVSSEVDVPEDNIRSTITIFGVGGPSDTRFPTITSATVDDAPLGWGALSGLSADPKRSDRVWSVSDSYYSPTKLFSVSTRSRPAVITSALTVTENGAPVGVDAEGLFARPSGGFWLAAEGVTGPGNEVLLLDDTAAVQQRIPLPPEVSAGVGRNGLEGITATGRGRSEQVYVALQRPLTGESAARIGRYDVFSGVWTWYSYPLDQGSGVGLSELVALDRDTFAVLERDNQQGTLAEVKRIYTFDLPRDPRGGPAVQPVPLKKTLARDLLPDLRADNGWVQEKAEGLTVGRDRQVYVVTDNDGVEDATGETVFLRLGSERAALTGSA